MRNTLGNLLFSVIAFSTGTAFANDFPTLDRVDNVLSCMKTRGGQTIENLYGCTCMIDAIATKMSYDEWVEASTFKSFRKMPGERGSAFRDSERGDQLVTKLDEVEKSAEKGCFIKRRTAAKVK